MVLFGEHQEGNKMDLCRTELWFLYNIFSAMRVFTTYEFTYEFKLTFYLLADKIKKINICRRFITG